MPALPRSNGGIWSSVTRRLLVSRIRIGRRRIVPGLAFFLGLVGKLEPVSRHGEKEDPTVRIGKALGELDAIGGVKAVAGNGFTIHGRSQSSPQSFASRSLCPRLSFDTSAMGRRGSRRPPIPTRPPTAIREPRRRF